MKLFSVDFLIPRQTGALELVSDKNENQLNIFDLSLQVTLVPKLRIGPFLTLSVRNGHKLKDWVFGIPGLYAE